jgi:hypothetical protein
MEQKRILFKKEKAYTSFPEIVELAKKPPYKSLVIFKPTKIVDFYFEPTERDWPKDKGSPCCQGAKPFDKTELL